mgnify:CR=1 FL=1
MEAARCIRFNPRSGCETGATNCKNCCSTALRRFNPRSGCETGATQRQVLVLCTLGVSIRAPVVRPERRRSPMSSEQNDLVSIRAPVVRPERQGDVPGITICNRVSIRAPVVRPERQCSIYRVVICTMFQSALRL